MTPSGPRSHDAGHEGRGSTMGGGRHLRVTDRTSDHARECVVQTGRTPSSLGRQSDVDIRVRTGRRPSSLGRQPDSDVMVRTGHRPFILGRQHRMNRSHSRARLVVTPSEPRSHDAWSRPRHPWRYRKRDHARECVVQTGRTPPSLGRKPDIDVRVRTGRTPPSLGRKPDIDVKFRTGRKPSRLGRQPDPPAVWSH